MMDDVTELPHHGSWDTHISTIKGLINFVMDAAKPYSGLQFDRPVRIGYSPKNLLFTFDLSGPGISALVRTRRASN